MDTEKNLKSTLFKQIFLGLFVALSVISIIVYISSTNGSFLQLFMGFMLFIFPIMFISSFGSTFAVFILTIYIATIGYFINEYEFYDTFMGVLLALVIGGSIAYFRIDKYEIFSSNEYIKDSTKKKED